MKKRGSMNFMMVMLIVVLALAAILLVIFGKVGKTTTTTIASASPAAIKAQAQFCKLGGIGYPDTDGDGLPDYCDPCPQGHQYFTQSDSDFLSDACDNKPMVTDKSAFFACCQSDPTTMPPLFWQSSSSCAWDRPQTTAAKMMRHVLLHR